MGIDDFISLGFGQTADVHTMPNFLFHDLG